VGVEAALDVEAFVSMGSKQIALPLNQVGRESLAVEVGNARAKAWNWDRGLDRTHYYTPEGSFMLKDESRDRGVDE
jgi:hypothetical protein